jgi:hypothetical protein
MCVCVRVCACKSNRVMPASNFFCYHVQPVARPCPTASCPCPTTCPTVSDLPCPTRHPDCVRPTLSSLVLTKSHLFSYPDPTLLVLPCPPHAPLFAVVSSHLSYHVRPLVLPHPTTCPTMSILLSYHVQPCPATSNLPSDHDQPCPATSNLPSERDQPCPTMSNPVLPRPTSCPTKCNLLSYLVLPMPQPFRYHI